MALPSVAFPSAAFPSEETGPIASSASASVVVVVEPAFASVVAAVVASVVVVASVAVAGQQLKERLVLHFRCCQVAAALAVTSPLFVQHNHSRPAVQRD